MLRGVELLSVVLLLAACESARVSGDPDPDRDAGALGERDGGVVPDRDARAPGGEDAHVPPPTGELVQFLTHDGDMAGNVPNSSAPNQAAWNVVLGFAWRRGSFGDWLDARQAPFGESIDGAVPYASIPVPAPGVHQADVTALVQRWLDTGENRGFYLRMRENAFPVRFAGRTDPDPDRRPRLVVMTSTGTFELEARCNATWASGTYGVISSSLRWELSGQVPAILQFDLAPVSGTLVSATLRITDTEHEIGSTSANGIVDVHEADPPRFYEPSVVPEPVRGLADEVDSFAALAEHPDVLFASDFAPGAFEGGWSFEPERIARPETGTTYARGRFEAGSNGSANHKVFAMRGLGAGARGVDVHRDELFVQYELFLEEDFGSNTSGIKIPAIGCQLGYWNEASGGYWQSVTGNGGAPGTGLLVQRGDRYEYEGHSVRLLLGERPADESAYADLHGIGIYPYNLDQTGPFPAGESFPYIALRRGHWYSIELYMKLNSMAGAEDALGNREIANPDGEYRAWINGYPVYTRTDYRWRRHPDFGVEGFWLDFYHGGLPPAPYTMHYRVDRVTMATRYIGPLL